MIGEEAIDQTRLQHVAVSGEPTERVLSCEEFGAWAAERASRCGHQEPQQRCRICQGTMVAAEAFGCGESHIVLMAAR